MIQAIIKDAEVRVALRGRYAVGGNAKFFELLSFVWEDFRNEGDGNCRRSMTSIMSE